jgi:hypothetical protein
MTETISRPAETEDAVKSLKSASQAVSSLIANNPEAPAMPAVRAEIEAEIKAELLKDVSLDEVRELIQFIRGGGLKKASASPYDAPDEFDEWGRNMRRMVHRMEVTGPSGGIRIEERPMAMSIKEARESNPPKDFFDIDAKVWILRGVKRQRDYPENTANYDGGPPR